MEKTDIKKAWKAFYSAPVDKFSIIDLPGLSYLMIDGAGDPNTATLYKEAVEALYTASYTLKFLCKDVLKRDYVVPPLEGLWWAEDMTDFVARRKERWLWTMMILVPEFVERPLADRAIATALRKKELRALSKVRFDTLEEGKVVQTLHLGSYDEEGPILRTMHESFLPESGLIAVGRHHEIYLSDPRKVSADKLKTILRQPVALASDQPSGAPPLNG
ncbi:GyrI-like domain-containing protein [Sphingomonas alpina]|uniref:GyrI-like domain-containing protein n=1 Tax=Sphingomonas alpina TaxID=653931 RepID=A0A7H0LMC4_9SPHN|nr:GyrI-like domain-containing protein [Sphingomonas alpina]QNQ10827.1 GyrI-like domain-containing protein [Sphingomonas alpina]